MKNQETDEAVVGATPAFVLRKPTHFEGQDYSKLDLNFDRLTGTDLINCERQYMSEANRTGYYAQVKDTSKLYLAYVAACAASVPPQLIFALSAADFTRITLRAQNFLLL